MSSGILTYTWSVQSIYYLQANASAANLSETPCFDAWGLLGLQASSLEALLGQGVLTLTARAGCSIQTSARGLGSAGQQPGGLEAVGWWIVDC